MVRSSLALVAVAAVIAACGANTETQESQPPAAPVAANEPIGRDQKDIPAVAVPENETDRTIRRELNRAIAEDPRLKDREISFLVSNGDISVTGTVRNEDERRKINDLAMNITGVKSVANALRVDD